MLAKRVATALILMAILLPAVFWYPPRVWGWVSLIFLAIAAFEWARLLHAASGALAVAVLVAVGGLLYLGLRGEQTPAPPFLLVVALALTLFWLVEGWRRLRVLQARGGGRLLAGVLLLGAWLAMYELREISVIALLSSMALVWVADIAAYFVGRALGKRKLAPQISPGKSWEGAIGGAIFVVAMGLLSATLPQFSGSLPTLLVNRFSAIGAAALLLILTALSVVGDLHESLLKRQAGVKDSGTSLPGHGGVLDRIDALIPVMPAALLLFVWVQQGVR